MGKRPGGMNACDGKLLADRVKGALFGLLIGDALSMPTHWFYGGERQVAAAYGRITGFVAPTTHLSGSIMSKSNTGGAGRGGFKGDVIGSVIFHGKKDFWKPGADYHYHQGMQAGDNTLEALLARRVVNATVAAGGDFNRTAIQQDYIEFMTTPDTHNVDSADSIVATIPVALTAQADTTAAEQVAAAVGITRESSQSQQYAALFASALRDVVRGGTVRSAATSMGNAVGYDPTRQLSSDPVTA